MKVSNLDTRSRQLINCHRALVKFMGTEHYVGVTRILPHFTEPDLVFGNIGGETPASLSLVCDSVVAGNCLMIPPYLTDQDYIGPRPAPAGDW